MKAEPKPTAAGQTFSVVTQGRVVSVAISPRHPLANELSLLACGCLSSESRSSFFACLKDLGRREVGHLD